MAAINDDLNSTFNSADLLSIPSRQGDPPKHSTPKRSGSSDERPTFDQSTIYEEPVMNSLARAAMSSRSEKEFLASYFDNELQKKRFSHTAQENRLDLLNQCIGSSDNLQASCRDTLSTGVYRKMPKYESVTPSFRPASSASDTDSLSSLSRKNVIGFESDKSMLNFGFVPVGKMMTLQQKIYNCDVELMRIKCSILKETRKGEESLDTEEHFEIIEVSAPLMGPGELCEIHVRYSPTKVEKNCARLIVERENGNRFRYSFTLVGNGGSAELSLDANFDAGIAYETTSSRAIIIRPDIFPRFWLKFENRGQRSAFVSLLATDRRGIILSREAGSEQQQVSIKPAQFVLDPVSQEGTTLHKMNVAVSVNDSFNWADDENRVQTSTPRQQLAMKQAEDGGRDSLLSSASTTSIHSDCAFQILVYWGEECQRQRIKSWERAFKTIFSLKGFRFTGRFINERELSAEQKSRQRQNSKEENAREFKESMRILTLNVVDERVRTYFPTQSDSIQPVLDNYRNRSILLREVCPHEESNSSSFCGPSHSSQLLQQNLFSFGRSRKPSSASSATTTTTNIAPLKPFQIFNGRDRLNNHF